MRRNLQANIIRRLATMLRLVILLCCIGGLSGLSPSNLHTLRKLSEKPSMLEVIKKHGYKGEQHKLITEDGYKLNLYRILPRQNCTEKYLPVLLMHGLSSSSFDWITLGPPYSFGFMLSDLCFDVWLGNMRGNSQSLGHVSLPLTSREFWNHSYHEGGFYDVPTMIDCVINTTRAEQIFFIGHSQGAAMFLVMDTLRPEYGAKVKFATFLAPAVFLGEFGFPVVTVLANHVKTVEGLFRARGKDFFSYKDLYWVVVNHICNTEERNKSPECKLFFIYVAEMCNLNGINQTKILDVYEHFPDISSVKSAVHLIQSSKSGKFQMYDYEPEQNLKIYGTRNPPEYPMNNSRSNISIFYGKNDIMIDIGSQEALAKALPKPPSIRVVEDERHQHNDFLFGSSSRSLVYDKIVEDLKRGMPEELVYPSGNMRDTTIYCPEFVPKRVPARIGKRICQPRKMKRSKKLVKENQLQKTNKQSSVKKI